MSAGERPLRECRSSPDHDLSVGLGLLVAEGFHAVRRERGTTWIVSGADRRSRRGFVDSVAALGREAGLEALVCRNEMNPTTLVGLVQVGVRRKLLADPPGLRYAAEAVRKALGLPLLADDPNEPVEFEAAFASLVLAWASQGPMLLILDELTGAVDPKVLRLVGHLASAVADAAVLVVVTLDATVDQSTRAVLDRVVEAGQARLLSGSKSPGSGAVRAEDHLLQVPRSPRIADEVWLLDAVEKADWSKVAEMEAATCQSLLGDAWLTMLWGNGDPTLILTSDASLSNMPADIRSMSSACALLALSGTVELASDWLSKASAMLDPVADEIRYLQGAKAVVDWQAGRWDESLDAASGVCDERCEGVPPWWAVLAETAICTARGVPRRVRSGGRGVQLGEPINLWATSGPCSEQVARENLDQIEMALCESAAQGELLWAPMLCGRLIELSVDAGDEMRARSWTRELDNLIPRIGTPWSGVIALLAHAQVDGDLGAAWDAARLADRHKLGYHLLLARYHVGRLGGPRTEAVEAFVGLRSLRDVTWQRRALRVLRQRGIPIPRSPRREARSRDAQLNLSDLEYQLACAAARGATNPELAARFALSRRTVEARLTDVYRKLGCRSRFDLQAAMGSALKASDPPGSSSL